MREHSAGYASGISRLAGENVGVNGCGVGVRTSEVTERDGGVLTASEAVGEVVEDRGARVVDVTDVDDGGVVVAGPDVRDHFGQQLERTTCPLELCDVSKPLVEDPNEFRMERVGLRDQVAVGAGMLRSTCQLLGLGEILVEAAVGVASGTGSVHVDGGEDALLEDFADLIVVGGLNDG